MKIESFESLKGQNIQIRTIRREDLAKIVRLYREEESTYFLLDPLKKKDFLTLQHSYQLFKEGLFSIEYIIETLKGEVEGLVRAFSHSHIVRLDIWGKSREYLLEAGYILLEYYFNKQVSRIETEVVENDILTFELYNQLNFYQEGILKEMISYKDTYRDVYLLSLLKEEYYRKK